MNNRKLIDWAIRDHRKSRVFVVAMMLLYLFLGTIPAYALAGSTDVLTSGADANSGAPYVFANPANLSQKIGFECDIMAAISHDMN